MLSFCKIIREIRGLVFDAYAEAAQSLHMWLHVQHFEIGSSQIKWLASTWASEVLTSYINNLK